MFWEARSIKNVAKSHPSVSKSVINWSLLIECDISLESKRFNRFPPSGKELRLLRLSLAIVKQVEKSVCGLPELLP